MVSNDSIRNRRRQAPMHTRGLLKNQWSALRDMRISSPVPAPRTVERGRRSRQNHPCGCSPLFASTLRPPSTHRPTMRSVPTAKTSSMTPRSVDRSPRLPNTSVSSFDRSSKSVAAAAPVLASARYRCAPGAGATATRRNRLAPDRRTWFVRARCWVRQRG